MGGTAGFLRLQSMRQTWPLSHPHAAAHRLEDRPGQDHAAACPGRALLSVAMWPRQFGRRSERHAGDGGTNPGPRLDLLIEHQRELFKIEDERIRALEVQAAAVATVALAGLRLSHRRSPMR